MCILFHRSNLRISANVCQKCWRLFSGNSAQIGILVSQITHFSFETISNTSIQFILSNHSLVAGEALRPRGRGGARQGGGGGAPEEEEAATQRRGGRVGLRRGRVPWPAKYGANVFFQKVREKRGKMFQQSRLSNLIIKVDELNYFVKMLVWNLQECFYK